MNPPLERYNVEGLFNIDAIPEEEHTEVCLDSDVKLLEKAYEEVKQKYDEVLKMLANRFDTSIGWSIEDFCMRAFELEYDDYNGFLEMDNVDTASIEEARKYLKKYDSDKFEDALYEMIRKHDATIGITWDTVDYYLNEYCLRKE